MKKVVILILIISFNVIRGQEKEPIYGFAKKDFFIDGAISYRSDDTARGLTVFNNSEGVPTSIRIREEQADSFIFSSRAGYFVSNHVALGVDFQYSSLNIDIEENNVPDLDTRRYAISAFARYYYTPQKRFSIFNTLAIGYVDVQNGFLIEELNEDGFTIRADVGAYYFLSKHFAIQSFFGLISYQTTDTEVEITAGNDSTNNNSFNVDLNIRNINFGLIYKF